MNITKTRQVKTPTRGTSNSAGIDFFVPDEYKPTIVLPGKSVCIPSGIHVNVPEGFMLTAFNKSGVATKRGLQVGACVVDEDYQGEVHIHLMNVGTENQVIRPGEKIVQFILVPVFYDTVNVIDTLNELYLETSERGTGGFGSTGIK